MALTTAQILAQIERRLPDEYEVWRPILAGMAAQGEDVSELLDDATAAVTVAGADDQWLTLYAHGYGIERTEGELDPNVRIRLRNVDDKLTRPAIKAVVDDVLDEAGSTPCRVAEWWEEDQSMWLGSSYLGQPTPIGDWFNVFAVYVPLIGDPPGIAAFLGNDDAYLGNEMYLGGAPILSEVYSAIVDEVERVRASGVRWWLFIDYAGDFI